MDAPTRRQFLQRGAAWGAIGLGVAAGATLAACGTAAKTASPTTTLATRPASDLEWRRLAHSLRGTLVRPNDAAYSQSRLLFDAALVPSRPQGIAYCASSDDVARCLAFARDHAIAVTARSGGHSYAGYSCNDGLVIDVSPLSRVFYDDATSQAIVGAGTRLIDFYDALAQHGRLVPAGSCPSVGVAGLSLGGGVGVLARRYALTCDNLVETTTVLADSTTLTVNDATHPELLWAQRGGGGGNFGVTTALTYRTYAVPPMTLFSLRFAWSAARDVLTAWMSWVPQQSDDLWANCLLESAGTDGLGVLVSGVWCGAPSSLKGLLNSFVALSGATPTSRFVGGDTFLAAMAIEAGCSLLSIAACHVSGQGAGVLSRAAFHAKSSFVVAPWSGARIDRALNSLAQLAGRAPDVGAALAFDALGGAVSRVGAHATAFAHRSAIADIQATHSWSTYSAPSQIAAGDEWLRELATNVFEPADGAYVNYIDPTLDGWLDAYYGDHVARLSGVKRWVDPDDVFHFAQSIPLRVTSRA
ncbi:MAG TPA: FAD-binding oxidoreductase [Acidimicrobiales bacterium]|nr:FAD-binding oxidoreductase [Acidimicrobiales bacterium]